MKDRAPGATQWQQNGNSPGIFSELVFPAGDEASRQGVGHLDGLGPLVAVVQKPAEGVDLTVVEDLFRRSPFILGWFETVGSKNVN